MIGTSSFLSSISRKTLHSSRLIRMCSTHFIKGKERRCYKYLIDSKGLIYYEDEEYKNYTTSIKDEKFVVRKSES